MKTQTGKIGTGVGFRATSGVVRSSKEVLDAQKAKAKKK
jgi:hypothetical protein